MGLFVKWWVLSYMDSPGVGENVVVGYTAPTREKCTAPQATVHTLPLLQPVLMLNKMKFTGAGGVYATLG